MEDNNLILDNSLNFYYIFIASGLILTFSVYYLFLSNNTNQHQNIEAITNEEIEVILNENAVNVINANIDDFTDSDYDTELDSEYLSTFDSDSDSTSDNESIINQDTFFMPNVDFDVCPIEELKHFEFTSLYAREIAEHYISDEEIWEFLS